MAKALAKEVKKDVVVDPAPVKELDKKQTFVPTDETPERGVPRRERTDDDFRVTKQTYNLPAPGTEITPEAEKVAEEVAGDKLKVAPVKAEVEKPAEDKPKPSEEVPAKVIEPVLEEPALDPALVAQATQFGLSAEEVKHFQSDEQLRAVIDMVALRQVKPPVPKAEEVTPKAQPAVVPVPVESAPDEFKLEIDEEVVDEALVKPLKALVAFINSKVKSLPSGNGRELEPVLQALIADFRQREVVRTTEWFDRSIAALGEAWEPIVGKGNVNEVRTNAEAFGNRNKVIEMMTQIAVGRKQRGLPPLTERELFQRSLAAAFPEQVQTVARTQLKADLTKRQNLETPQPTHRKTIEAATPEDRAKRTVEAKYKEMRGGAR